MGNASTTKEQLIGEPEALRLHAAELEKVEAQRKQAEEELTKKAKIVDTITDAVITTDLSGNITSYNTGAERMYGYKAQEVIRKPVSMFYLAEDIPLLMDQIAEVLKGNTISSIESRIIGKDKKEVPVILSLSPIRNSAGRIIELAGISKDITERKLMEETLRESNVQLEVLRQVTIAIHSSLDLEQVFKKITEVATSSLGYTTAFIVTRSDDGKRFGMKAVTSKKHFLPRIGKILGFSLKNLSVPLDSVLKAGVCPVLEGKAVIAKSLAEVAYPIISQKACSAFEKLGGSRNFIAAPLRGEQGVLGAIFVTSPRDEVSDEELKMVQDFADAASSSLINARLYKQAKETEIALQQSEASLKTSLESAPDGVYLSDLKGTFLYGNKKAEEITGYKKEELVGKSFLKLNLLPKKYLAKASKLLVLNAMGRTTGPDELELIRKDGSRIWIEINAAPIKRESERIVIGFVRDITERKRAEEEIKVKDSAIASSINAVAIASLEGNITYVNQSFLRMWGYDEKEILGKNAIEFWQVAEEAMEVMQVAMDRGGWIGELTAKRKDGSFFDAQISASVVRDEAGEPICRFGSFVDITERKRTEEKIKHAAEEWRTTFDSIADLISIQDKDFRLVRVNKAFADTFKMKPRELIGKTCYEVVHGTKEPVPNCPHQKTLRTKKPARAEFFEPHLGIHLEVSTSPIFNEEGEVIASVYIARDITESKQAEAEKRELEQRAQLVSRLTSIGEMVSGTAHELNNPLTSVIGFSQLLMEGEIPDDIREDLGTICSEAQRAAEIVKNLLTFARKHEPVKQLTNVNSIVEGVLKLRDYEQRVNNIQVITQFGPELPEVMVDYFQMQQVFLNIIINAEGAMLEAHGQGTLTITTQKVNSAIRTSFTDDGPGIAKETLNRIFDPLFTTKEVGKGTGLGLSICHGIVAEHGGTIYAKSKLDKGATFIVELPINAH